MGIGRTIVEALGPPAYGTDADGYLTSFNLAAINLWGREPSIGERWSGAVRLFEPDGTLLPHDSSPLAIALSGGGVRDREIVVERPDGGRTSVVTSIAILRNADRSVKGTISLLLPPTSTNSDDLEQARLAAIVSSSDDIIISKTLDGIITSWNASATRILGYTEAEMIGKSIMRIIPDELAHEEVEIIEHMRRGDRIEHFDTERVRKDSSRVNLSLTVSPIRDRSGRIVGASKVARDVTERKRSEDLQRLLFNELNHRVKNTLATVQALASQSLRRSESPGDFVNSFNGRLQSLARAHDLLVRGEMKSVPLPDLVREQVVLGKDDRRVHTAGPEIALRPEMAVQLGLLLHELATNARKYGALVNPDGSVDIQWVVMAGEKPELAVEWRETSVSQIALPSREGFGTALIKNVLAGHGGSTRIEYLPFGIRCRMRIPISGEDVDRLETLKMTTNDPIRGRPGLVGKKVLVVEDEHIIAIEIISILADAGMVVVGPASSIDQARSMILAGEYDIVLLDANLQGHPVGELAGLLTERGAKFAVCTGYGRDALPIEAQQVPILSKPFGERDLTEVVASIL